ncbi:MAG: hypothetical protein O3C40_32250 [Planctomycetota bacterium]|nr:hypothetical protein [Planctomycetota bacterium]
MGADAADGEAPTTIAALPFAEASADGRYAPLAEAIGDILMARLSEAEGVAFVERTAINAVLNELELSAATDAADQARRRKGKKKRRDDDVALPHHSKENASATDCRLLHLRESL